MTYDPTAQSHLEWIGYVQPVGVVVSTPALVAVGAAIDRNFIPLHRRFLSVLPQDAAGEVVPKLEDLPRFVTEVLGWSPGDLAGPDESLTISVPGYDEILHPDFIVKDGDKPLLLINKTAVADLDTLPPSDQKAWHASVQAKFERLLRETSIPIGLLVSPDVTRLVYAPKGESSGHITFRIADMVPVAGRPILAALHMLLNERRLFTVAPEQRLPALLVASRRFQNVVSNQLSGQVMEALFALLRGFQAAHNETGILARVLEESPNQVYAGLLTVLLRLVFILYAEDRDLLSSDEIFVKSYSVGGLFERLREDKAHYPDTMDQRYGAWAQLVVLFRLIYSGARHGKMRIPGRKGYLFDPDRYPFLEGRADADSQVVDIPRVPDGVVWDVLQQLLMLDGERLSYRNLDVEQIGSVYEAMMGFELHRALGPSIALKPKKRSGAPITINLAELLTIAPAKRNEWLGKHADQKLTGKAEAWLMEAATVDALLKALDTRVAKNVTPTTVPAGAMIFQPSAERRRSGSHYTPRSLTQPIVEAALAPVLRTLGDSPRPERVLALKVCDPAMGSGAFLVEACRQLGDVLVRSWHQHDATPPIAADEEELLHARRVVAQRCLYGVDKNEMAVDLAKMSLWLATLARDHEFTFLDHALRHGDSLVGFTARQIAAFDWEIKAQIPYMEEVIRGDIARAAGYRRRILEAQDGTPYAQLSQQLAAVEDQLSIARNLGDVLVAAFFKGTNAKSRATQRILLVDEVKLAFGVPAPGSAAKPDAAAGVRLSDIGAALRQGPKPIIPFHWELEFPEVFALDETLRPAAGFDAIVGNPPFAGKNTLIEGSPEHYIDWLKRQHPESHGNADLVAHFFRRAFNLLRQGGSFGLIATNTIGQGDTRSTGLRYIAMNGGTIFRAVKRLVWPGEAAVVVSVVHVAKGPMQSPYLLNGRNVDRITAFLFHAGGNEDPSRLEENAGKSFQGSIVLGMGFTFDDTDKKAVASPLTEMHRLIAKDPRNADRIFPYLGGDEVNNSPTHAHHRYVINFEDFPLRRKDAGHSWYGLTEETQRKQLREGIVAPNYAGPVAADWPDLLAIVEARVKPERDKDNRDARRLEWWKYAERTPALNAAKASFLSIFAVNCGANPHLAVAGLASNQVFANTLALLMFDQVAAFTLLQSRLHEVWARFMASSLEDRLRYTPSDCFETFPFSARFETDRALENAGRAYYEFRAGLMIRNKEGLTKTYNRFHRPDERSADIAELRRLHDAMDRVVLNAYGWRDLRPAPEFLPEFETDEDQDEESAQSKQKGRKQPKFRYRWPDEIHDEVLARLLALNRERAAQQGERDRTVQAAKPKGRVKSKPHTEIDPVLF